MKQLLAPLPNCGASIFFTVVFLVFFVALCVFVYRKDRQSVYRHLSNLPLEKD